MPLEKDAPRSVILITNALQFLSDPRVDRIVVLQDGKVVEEGTYSSLVGTHSIFGRMVSVVDKTGETTKSIERLSKTGAITAKVLNDEALVVDIKPDTTPIKSLMTEEAREEGNVDIGIYWSWIQAAGGNIVPILVFITFFAFEAMSVLSNWWLTYWSSHGSSGTSQTYFLAVYAIINASAALADIIRTILLSFFGLLASRKVKSEFFNELFVFREVLLLPFSSILPPLACSFFPKCLKWCFMQRCHFLTRHQLVGW
jgi:ATP-binding cassette, subfamily C (CFTR/MRP), member 1